MSENGTYSSFHIEREPVLQMIKREDDNYENDNGF